MKIAQVGTFDLDNLGDLLFPWVTSRLVSLVLGVEEEIEFSLYSPTMSGAPLYTDQLPYSSISQLDIDDELKPFDFILIGGGDIIRDDDYSLYRTYGVNSPSLTFTQILSPTETPEARLALLAVGLPYEIEDDFSIFLKNSFGRIASACVRDTRSAHYLKSGGDVIASIVPDFVHSIPYFLSKEHCKSVAESFLDKYSDGYLCFQGHADVCSPVDVTAKVLKEIEQAINKPFVLIEIGGCLGDTEYLRELSSLTGYTFVSKENFPAISLEQKVSVIANCSGFIGSSLHGNIISNSYAINNISYVGKYSHKIREYFSLEGNGTLFDDFNKLLTSIDSVIATLVSDTSGKAELAESKHQKILLFLKNLLQVEGHNISSFSKPLDRLYKVSHSKACRQLVAQELTLGAEKKNAIAQIHYRDALVTELEKLLAAEKKNAADQIYYRDALIIELEALLAAEKKNAVEQIHYRDALVAELEALLAAEKKHTIEKILNRSKIIKKFNKK